MTKTNNQFSILIHDKSNRLNRLINSSWQVCQLKVQSSPIVFKWEMIFTDFNRLSLEIPLRTMMSVSFSSLFAGRYFSYAWTKRKSISHFMLIIVIIIIRSSGEIIKIHWHQCWYLHFIALIHRSIYVWYVDEGQNATDCSHTQVLFLLLFLVDIFDLIKAR